MLKSLEFGQLDTNYNIIQRLISKKRRGLSPIISTVMLTGFMLVLGLGVITWANSQASASSSEYAETVNSNLQQIQEKVIFEYAYYNASNQELVTYIMNAGQSDNVAVTTAIVSNSSWYEVLTNIQLRNLSGETIQNLDASEEGYFKLQLNLASETIYKIRIVTERGRSFETTLVA